MSRSHSTVPHSSSRCEETDNGDSDFEERRQAITERINRSRDLAPVPTPGTLGSTAAPSRISLTPKSASLAFTFALRAHRTSRLPPRKVIEVDTLKTRTKPSLWQLSSLLSHCSLRSRRLHLHLHLSLLPPLAVPRFCPSKRKRVSR